MRKTCLYFQKTKRNTIPIPSCLLKSVQPLLYATTGRKLVTGCPQTLLSGTTNIAKTIAGLAAFPARRTMEAPAGNAAGEFLTVPCVKPKFLGATGKNTNVG